jgi:oligopeptide/dipeptide ABC transporter ATP-binding protein
MTMRLDERGDPSPAAMNAQPQPAVMVVENLQVAFRTPSHMTPVVRGLDLTLVSGKAHAIVGESGSGKSVTARALLGLLPRNAVASGSVRLLGKELMGLKDADMRRHRGKDIAMVFQDPTRSLNPTMQVGDQIAEALRKHERISRRDAWNRAVDLLERVAVPAARQRARDYPHQLSGGMRQRVMIAIAISCGPKVLVADEPTTALDVTTQAEIMALLQDLQDELRMSLVLITHNLGLAAAHAQEIAVMYAGRIVERAPTRELFGSMRMPYTRALLESIPRLSGQPHVPLPVVSGRPPSPGSLPSGCPFHPRCPGAQARCAEEEPALEEQKIGHQSACWFPL